LQKNDNGRSKEEKKGHGQGSAQWQVLRKRMVSPEQNFNVHDLYNAVNQYYRAIQIIEGHPRNDGIGR